MINELIDNLHPYPLPYKSDITENRKILSITREEFFHKRRITISNAH